MIATSQQPAASLRRALRAARRPFQLSLLGALLLACSALAATAPSAPTAPPAPPERPEPITPREFFNAGTEKLRAGKLREAEAYFESALGSQSARLQPPALYNLGHVRFDQGIEAIKKGPAAGPTNDRGEAAAQMADQATREAAAALASNDVQQMVAAYLRGRGARHELKAATKAVQRALETHGSALNKWQRSDGDFRSDLELTPNDTDARANSDTVERWIARLIDTLTQLQQTGAELNAKGEQLGEKMKALRGRIPAPDMPPGGAGDDDEEEDMPNGPKPGDKEGPSKQGEQMTFSPEEAGWLLEGFKLDSERRLPMGQKDTAEPTPRDMKPW
jgi:tetratricopeptide (TPR) repeat protein